MNGTLSKDTHRVLHEFMRAMRMMELGDWSEILKGVTLLDIGVLYHAAMNPDAMLGEIRQILQVPHSTLSSAINRLERRKLIKRVISDRDKRSFVLDLTEKGLKAHEEHLHLDAMITEHVLKALDNDEERETLIRLLGKVSRALRQV
jgi:DNA-binding MarR family transcriptional regulator